MRPTQYLAVVPHLLRGTALTVLAGLLPRAVVAQQATDAPRWSFSQEVSAVVGSTFLDGSRIASVHSPAGVSIGVGLQRAIRHDATGGILVRAAILPVSATEAGSTWSLGTLQEVSALGQVSFEAGTWGRVAARLEGAGGITVFTGLGSALPFSDLSVPMGSAEGGLAIGRPPVEGRRQWWVTARVGVVRMSTAAGTATITPGWGSRFLIGVRTSR